MFTFRCGGMNCLESADELEVMELGNAGEAARPKQEPERKSFGCITWSTANSLPPM